MPTHKSNPGYLSQRATGFDLKSRFALDRYPISLSPGSATRVNHERLPDPDQLADMDLAYRQDLVPDSVAKALATNHCFYLLILQTVFAFLIPLAAYLVPIGFGLSLAGTFSALVIGMRIYRGKRLSLGIVIAAVAIPLVTLMLLHGASYLTTRRIVGTLILGVGSIVLLHRVGSRPTNFYFDWIYTHVTLRPEERRKRKEARREPDLRVFAVILLIAVFVPWLSLILAIVLIVAVCAYTCRDHRYGLSLISKAMDAVGPYFMYGRPPFGGPGITDFPLYDAPGVWIPKESLRRRRLTLYLITASIFIPLTLGLCFFIPYEFLSEPFYATFESHVLTRQGVTGFQHIDPTFDPEELPPPLLQYLKPPTFEDPGGYARRPDPVAPPSFETRLAAGKDYIVSLLSQRPHVAPWLVMNAITDGRTALGWLIPLAILIGVPLNTLVLLAVYREAIDDLSFLRKTIEESGANDPRPEWEWYVDRIKNSPHVAKEPLGRIVREAEHLFLGVEPYFRFPILLDKAILDEHAYIVGETGSGKTALGIMPLLIQLIRGHAIVPKTVNAETPTVADSSMISPPPPMVIIDLKGDPALFNTVREESEARRRQLGITDPKDPRFGFRFLSLEKDRPTHLFNPFASLESASCTLIQLCHLILDSLNLSHGEGYGRGYYSRKNRQLLLEALEKLPADSRSFDALYPIIRQLARSQQHRDCFELVSTIHALTKYPQVATFQPLKRPADAIHMPSVIEHSQIVYFWLPAVLESITVREVGKLALFCLLSAAIDRQRQRVDEAGPRRTYLVIDEFQRIAGENFKVILEQARSFGVSVIMANQSVYDLNTHDIDLRPTVRTNTRLKQYFALGDLHDIQELKEMSGEEIATLHSWSTAGEDWDYKEMPRILPRERMQQKSENEFIKNRLMVNDILATSDHPLHSIIHILRGSGYTQYSGLPIPLCSTWPMHESEYRRRQLEPWPAEQPNYELETVVPKKSPTELERESAQEVARERALIDERIRELMPDEPEEQEKQ